MLERRQPSDGGERPLKSTWALVVNLFLPQDPITIFKKHA